MGTAGLAKPAKIVVVASMLAIGTGVAAGAQDAPIPLGTQATTALASLYLNPPTGTVVLGGVTFNVGNAIILANGASATYTGSFQNTSAVHLLLNTQNTTMFWDATPVGSVTLTFSNGATQTVTLTPDLNIREWRVGAAGTVNTVSDPSSTQVWSGLATDNTAAVIDMLTVTVAASNSTATLTGVSVSNTNTFGSLNILLSGLTVTDPAPVPTPTPTPSPTHGKHHKHQSDHKPVTTVSDDHHDGHGIGEDRNSDEARDGRESRD